jgi:hypothetical protein
MENLANAIFTLYTSPETFGINTNSIKNASNYMVNIVNPITQARIMFESIWKITNYYK